MYLSIGKYYGSQVEEESPSVATIVKTHLTKMTEVMNEHVTSRTMVDVETADKVRVTPFIGFYFCVSYRHSL